MSMSNDFGDYQESPLCMHKECIDCPLLANCKKDENEYDAEKVKEYIASLHCPKCGFKMFATTDGGSACIMCLLEGDDNGS